MLSPGAGMPALRRPTEAGHLVVVDRHGRVFEVAPGDELSTKVTAVYGMLLASAGAGTLQCHAALHSELQHCMPPPQMMRNPRQCIVHGAALCCMTSALRWLLHTF